MLSAMTKRYGLSKSRITDFEQCPRKLWLSVHRPELRQEEGAEGRFATGHAVGDIACAAVPGGVMIDADPDLAAAVRRTTELMAGDPMPMFEASFSHDGVLVRADVMEPDGAGGWHVAEVKASNSPKPYHWRDLATHLWVMRAAGVRVSRASIRHLDRDFRLEMEGDYRGLLTDTPAGDDVDAIAGQRPAVAAAARAVLAGSEPERLPGAHCADPFPCGFRTWCWRDLPPGPEWPIEDLPTTGATVAAEWAAKGVTELTAIPAGGLKKPLHERIRAATVSGDIFHDAGQARAMMADWDFPRTYLDFETVQHAIPRWVGTGPYGQTPFQFSAHVETADGAIEHRSFLSIDGSDPRPAIAAALAELPGEGAVVAWNKGFEGRCLRELADAVPAHATALLSLADRLVDLVPVARACWYHRDQRGSWSIKAVLPTIAPELAYDGLEVKDGGMAMEVWHEAADPATSPVRVQAIRVALEAYCERDTWAMVVVLRRLAGEG